MDNMNVKKEGLGKKQARPKDLFKPKPVENLSLFIKWLGAMKQLNLKKIRPATVQLQRLKQNVHLIADVNETFYRHTTGYYPDSLNKH